MDARELLKSWPGWSNAGTEKVLLSPAWRLMADFGGAQAKIVRIENLSPTSIALEITLDGEHHQLLLAPSPVFPDLWLMKDLLTALPKEVLLALVEKECGDFFQTLEHVFRRQLAVIGLSQTTAPEMPEMNVFSMQIDSAAENENNECSTIDFAIDLDAALEHELALLVNLDVDHESIRSLERTAVAEFGTLAATPEECAELAVGDCLLIDENFWEKSGWRYEDVADSLIHVIHPQPDVITFGAMVDGAFPPLPSTALYALEQNGRVIANAELATIGLVQGFRIVNL